MYLSRISLSPEAADDVRFGGVFDSPYQLHQEIWTLFSDDPNRRRDFLYRLDQDGRSDRRLPRVFSLSRRAPRPLPGVWQVETREFHPAFEVGNRLRFVLRANPVVARSGSRHDVVTDAIRKLKEQAVPRRAWPSPEQIVRSACIEWLARRAETNGFALSAGEVQVERHEVQSFTKPDGWPVRLAVCDFEGVLRVTEREPFLAALRTGIGPAKGFGNGLLLCGREAA
ncbi:MAG TPA: type I-E CRISPR-associated protein Cas6/Cse3/CasE [Thermoanaerobaculia bacterium]|nr:type I-E CRISPR-associated protein Cas6/Cse3/CasE [Thermoanaerobaculia bacterium]